MISASGIALVYTSLLFVLTEHLPMLETDENTFRTWNERLINVVSQERYGSRKLFKAMMDYVDQEYGGNFEELFQGSEVVEK